MEATDQEELAKTNGEKDKKKKVERKPTSYVALIEAKGEHEGLLSPVVTPDGEVRVYQGYRRDDVLQELIADGEIAVPDDKPEDERQTPWVYIVPARGFVKLRGFVPPPSSVAVELG